jgi:hypothetical protein
VIHQSVLQKAVATIVLICGAGRNVVEKESRAERRLSKQAEGAAEKPGWPPEGGCYIPSARGKLAQAAGSNGRIDEATDEGDQAAWRNS